MSNSNNSICFNRAASSRGNNNNEISNNETAKKVNNGIHLLLEAARLESNSNFTGGHATCLHNNEEEDSSLLSSTAAKVGGEFSSSPSLASSPSTINSRIKLQERSIAAVNSFVHDTIVKSLAIAQHSFRTVVLPNDVTDAIRSITSSSSSSSSSQGQGGVTQLSPRVHCPDQVSNQTFWKDIICPILHSCDELSYLSSVIKNEEEEEDIIWNIKQGVYTFFPSAMLNQHRDE